MPLMIRRSLLAFASFSAACVRCVPVSSSRAMIDSVSNNRRLCRSVNTSSTVTSTIPPVNPKGAPHLPNVIPSRYPWLQYMFDEHRHISAMMNVLKHCPPGANRADIDPRLSVLVDIAKEFAEEHHDLEETVLWKTLAEAGFTSQDALIAELKDEHVRLVTLLGEISWAIKSAKWSQHSRERVVIDTAAFASLQDQHIEKENKVLLPAVVKFLTPDSAEKLRVAFEKYMGKRVAETGGNWEDLVEQSKKLVKQYKGKEPYPSSPEIA